MRALQVEVNERLLNQLKLDGVVSQVNAPVPFDKSPDDPVESPQLAKERFEPHFTRLSQRPAWSVEMYNWAVQQLEECVDDLKTKLNFFKFHNGNHALPKNSH